MIFDTPVGVSDSTMSCTLEVKIEVYRNYESTENVSVSGKESKKATLTKEIETVERCLEIIEGKENDVVRMCWNEVKDTEEFEEFGWYGPYARGEYTLNPTTYESIGVTVHNIVDAIAKRDDVEDKAGIYKELQNRTCVEFGERRFLEYLAEERGIDTSYYVHGESV